MWPTPPPAPSRPNANSPSARRRSTPASRPTRLRACATRAACRSYVAVLTAENAVIDERRAYADAQARAFTLDIALVRALGGGYAGA